MDDAEISTDEIPLRLEFVFAHTEKYPEEKPLIKVRSLRGFRDADIATLQALMDEQAEENLGLPMIFTLITAAQEWLDEKAASDIVPEMDPEAELKRARDAEEARVAELRAHGTAVTPETFSEWKARFDAEMSLSQSSINSVINTKTNQLTGKQWFMQQKTDNEPSLEGENEEDWTDGAESLELESESEFDDDDGEDEMLEEMLRERGEAA